LDGLAKWLGERSITEMINKARDRNGWRYMTANICRLDDDIQLSKTITFCNMTGCSSTTLHGILTSKYRQVRYRQLQVEKKDVYKQNWSVEGRHEQLKLIVIVTALSSI
jgi:hypothetical protein